MYRRKTETGKEKRKTFQGTEGIVEYVLHSLKRYKVTCEFSGKDFDADKTVQYKKREKKQWKSMKLLVQFKLLPTQELICRFRKKRSLKEK